MADDNSWYDAGSDFGNIGADFEQMPDLSSFNTENLLPQDINQLLADLGNMGTDLGPTSSMGMDKYLLEDLGLGSLSDSTGGFYDEISGKFIPSAYGNLQAPLDDTSGTNLESMKDYTYDQKTGTWTTPSGETYTPNNAPSGQAQSGAQVMVNSGALPSGYGGLTPTKGSTADLTKGGGGGGGGTKTGGTNTTQKGTQKSGMDPMSMLLLMMMLSQMSKGGNAAPLTTIPQLSANRSQLPYAAPSRPGAGGVSYFNPTTYSKKMAGGGIAALGGYSDGGQLLKGPGDGVSDSIPATIAGKQPARLADGEFVVPARIVSELGNGSTDAGARKLYAMMKRIEKTRKGAKNIAANTKADRHLPA